MGVKLEIGGYFTYIEIIVLECAVQCEVAVSSALKLKILEQLEKMMIRTSKILSPILCTRIVIGNFLELDYHLS